MKTDSFQDDTGALSLRGGCGQSRAAGAGLGNISYVIEKLPGLNHLFQTAETGHRREYRDIEETFYAAALELIGDWICT